MKTPAGYPCHQCAPRDWRNIANLTGDYDFDATIAHRANPSIPDRLALYLRKGRGAYQLGTGYNGLTTYHGDA